METTTQCHFIQRERCSRNHFSSVSRLSFVLLRADRRRTMRRSATREKEREEEFAPANVTAGRPRRMNEDLQIDQIETVVSMRFTDGTSFGHCAIASPFVIAVDRRLVWSVDRFNGSIYLLAEHRRARSLTSPSRFVSIN